MLSSGKDYRNLLHWTGSVWDGQNTVCICIFHVDLKVSLNVCHKKQKYEIIMSFSGYIYVQWDFYLFFESFGGCYVTRIFNFNELQAKPKRDTSSANPDLHPRSELVIILSWAKTKISPVISPKPSVLRKLTWQNDWKRKTYFQQ